MAVSNPHFNKVSGNYDRGRVSEDIWFWVGESERIARLDADSLVIDMGCGTGNYGLGIQARTGCTVVGFDPSIGMLKQAREKMPDFPIVQSVAEHMPFRGGVFDLVYAAQVMAQRQVACPGPLFEEEIVAMGGFLVDDGAGERDYQSDVLDHAWPGTARDGDDRCEQAGQGYRLGEQVFHAR